MNRLPGAELTAELDRDPPWMYSFQVGRRHTPIHHPMLESIHATRASLIEGPVREALAAAGPGARALDVACCEGWFSQRLVEWGAGEVLGVDIREQSIRRAQLVSDHLGYDGDRLSFRAADIFSLTAEELGHFDVVLCLGLVYHVENPMGLLRLLRAVTRGLCAIESQTARVETPALFGFTTRQAFEATDAVLAVHHEHDQASNQLASAGGSLSFCPNPAALRLMTTVAGFGDVTRAQPRPEHDPDFHTGDRTLLIARPG